MQLTDQTRELVDFHEWEGAMQKQFDVSETFGIKTERTIGFEIVFTAFLATVILGAPDTQTILDSLIPWVAGGLLLTTLIRRMALDNVFIEAADVIRKTMWVIFVLTNIAVLYLSLSLGGWLSNIIGINIYLLTGILLIGSTYGVVLAYEYLFYDFFLWNAVISYNDALDESEDLSNLYRITALQLARLLLRLSPHTYHEDYFVIKRIYAIDLEGARRAGRMGMTFLSILSLGLILGLIALLTFLLAWVTETSIGGAILFSAVLAISCLPIVRMTEFVYGRYGSAEVEQHFSAGSRSLRLVLVLYIIVLLHGGLLNRMAQLL